MTDLLEAALAYAKRGWPIFPTKSDKTPYIQQWETACSTDPEKIQGWWAKWPKANIGFVPGEANMMVLDLDPGYDREQLVESIGNGQHIGGPLDTGLQATTPRGGYHLFFTLNENEIVAPSASKIIPNVDVRSHKSYILLHPSKTKDGDYAWAKTNTPLHRTDEMIRVANISRAKAEDNETWKIAADLPESITKATTYLLEHAKVAHEGEGGDHLTYATAAIMRSNGLSKEKALELMYEHWNPRCTPPWDYEALKVKVDNGYAYAKDPPGNYSPEYQKVQLVQDLKTIKQVKESIYEEGRYRFTNLEGLKHLKPPEWLVEDFITDNGYVLMYGPSDTFKTFAALDIALGIVHNERAWPHPGYWGQKIKGGEGPVLYAAGEGHRSFKKRVYVWQQYYLNKIVEEGPFVLLDPVPLVKFIDHKGNLTEDFASFIKGARKSHSEYRLTVLDTIGRSMQGITEDSQENASLFTGLVTEIQNYLGGAVLAIHHTGHTAQRARGSSVFGTDPDTIVGFERINKSYTVNMSMYKQKDEEEWKEPKFLAFEKVNLDLKTSSLIVRHATQEEKLLNPKKPLPFLNRLIISRLQEYNTGHEILKAEMNDYLTAKSELEPGEVKKEVEKIIHDPSQPANRYFRGGRWVS